MKDVARTIGTASLLAIIFAAPAAMATEWKHFSQKANYNQIAAWVNNTCKPKDATGIVGTISVTPKVTDAYDVHVWCRMDNSDAKWAMETSAFVQGGAAGLGAKSGDRPNRNHSRCPIMGGQWRHGHPASTSVTGASAATQIGELERSA